jgi:hypothetical protein
LAPPIWIRCYRNRFAAAVITGISVNGIGSFGMFTTRFGGFEIGSGIGGGEIEGAGSGSAASAGDGFAPIEISAAPQLEILKIPRQPSHVGVAFAKYCSR